jgi:hypothetical protein
MVNVVWFFSNRAIAFQAWCSRLNRRRPNVELDALAKVAVVLGYISEIREDFGQISIPSGQERIILAIQDCLARCAEYIIVAVNAEVFLTPKGIGFCKLLETVFSHLHNMFDVVVICYYDAKTLITLRGCCWLAIENQADH